MQLARSIGALVIKRISWESSLNIFGRLIIPDLGAAETELASRVYYGGVDMSSTYLGTVHSERIHCCHVPTYYYGNCPSVDSKTSILNSRIKSNAPA